jgi:hypothetical protein
MRAESSSARTLLLRRFGRTRLNRPNKSIVSWCIEVIGTGLKGSPALLVIAEAL